MVLNDLQGRFDLVSMLLSAKPNSSVALDGFRQLIKKDYMAYIKGDDGFPECADTLRELQNISFDMELFIRHKNFYNKNLIVLAGSFGSGKSTFCNSLFCSKDVMLPVNDSPKTAVSAYVVSGDVPNVFGLTATGACVELGADAYKRIDHDFLKSLNFNLKNLMPSVEVHVPMPKNFERICFVDASGMSFIRQTKMLLWFVDLEVADSLDDSSVEFLKDARSKIPGVQIAVICNKAERRYQEDIDKILNNVVDVLKSNAIPYEGVVAYSSLQRKSYGYRGKTLECIFDEINRLKIDQKKELQKRLKSLFRKHINADAERVQGLFEKIKTLNKYLQHFRSMMSADSQNREVLEHAVNDLSVQKSNLERDMKKFIDNRETAVKLSAKMDGMISLVFKDFDAVADDLFVMIPAGSFTMGSDEGPKDSRPAHSVSLDSFMMKSTLVTQAEWREIMGEMNQALIKGDSLPVCGVSFLQATRFCNKLSEMEMLTPCYDDKGKCNFDVDGYRLPTEAEWEYAASSCSDIPLKNCAWYKDNSDGRVQPVAQKEENALGLFDMLGNVYEWVNDYWADYSSFVQMNPHGPASGFERVIRGGSYKSNEKNCLVTARNMAEEDDTVMPIGFRVVRRI